MGISFTLPYITLPECLTMLKTLR